MAEKPTSRKYIPGDEERIVKVLDTVFEGWPFYDLTQSNLDHWMWKYQNNYTEKLVGVTELDNKIVGCGHTVTMKVKVFDQVHLCGIGADVVVLKEYRRRGVRNSFRSLIGDLRKAVGLSIVYSITSNPIVIDIFNRQPNSHKLPFELIHHVRIKDIDLHLEKNPKENAWVKKLGYIALDTLRSLKQLVVQKEKDDSSVEISMVESFDDRVDGFWEQVSKSYELKTVTDQKYLNWRYCDPRSGPYKILLAQDGEEVVGYLVLRVNRIREDYSTGFIVDMLSFNDRTDVIESLLSVAMSYFDENNVNIINFLAIKGYIFNKCLMKFGFLDFRRNHFIYYNLPQEIDYLQKVVKSNHNRIHFCFGDLDVI